MQLASCTIHPKPADDASSEPVYEFTAEQVKAIEELRRKLNFTPDEVDQRLRRTQAGLRRIAAASTLQEQQRIGAQVWVEWVERPRAARRVQAARRVAPVPPVQRMPGHSLAAPRERREASSSRTSGQDPGDGDPDDGPWALSLVDRAPFLWRLRTLRCRLLEIREGVDR